MINPTSVSDRGVHELLPAGTVVPQSDRSVVAREVVVVKAGL